MKKPIDSDQQWIKPDGKPSQYFLEVMQNLSKNGLFEGVSTTSPTNGQVMLYNSTTKLWTPGSN